MRVIAVDPVNDLALLQADVQSKGIPIYFNYGTDVKHVHYETIVKRGEEVLTLGYPSPQVQGVQQKATFGRVNAVTGFADDKRFMQVDLPIQPGNSGGPLLNTSGAVVGVVTSRMQGGFQNVNYAIRVGYILELVPKEIGVSGIAPEEARQMPMQEIAEHFQSSVVLILAGQ